LISATYPTLKKKTASTVGRRIWSAAWRMNSIRSSGESGNRNEEAMSLPVSILSILKRAKSDSENLRLGDETWKVQRIEPVFKEKMFEEAD